MVISMDGEKKGEQWTITNKLDSKIEKEILSFCTIR